jgi:alanine racemase
MQSDRLAEITSGTHAVIDLDVYACNIRHLRAQAGGRRLMAIVKANAYGHGAVACAEAAVEAGASYLGVARIDEALELRRAGVSAPLLVIGPPNIAQVEVAIRARVALTVATRRSAEAVVAAAQRSDQGAVVHLKIDTAGASDRTGASAGIQQLNRPGGNLHTLRVGRRGRPGSDTSPA